ncbi:MAG: VCBS repeat-containing protein [bacterium]|nr:VCBS repeat-containing protein [bacterium]
MLASGPALAGEQPLTKSRLAGIGGGLTIFNGAASVEWADLDGDGDLDALAAAATDGMQGEVGWWRYNSVSGSFGNRIAIDNTYCGARDVHAVDLDGDGDLDVVSTSFFGDVEMTVCDGATTHLGELAWWENTAGDASTWSAKKSITNAITQMDIVTSADLDCDGDVDLVGAVRGDDQIRWWESDGTPGDGGWTEHELDVAAELDASSVAIADFDSDGDPDVAGTASGADDVLWWQNDGSPADGGWMRHTVDGDFSDAQSVAAADINADGKPDVVASSPTGDEIAWFENDGTPTGWSKRPIDVTLDSIYLVRTRDVDLDGDADVLAAAGVAGIVSWYENRAGDGSVWSRHTLESSYSDTLSVDAADFDRDGDIDFLASDSTLDEVAVWENGSPVRSGKFGPAQEVIAATATVKQVAAGDLDGDGDVDLAGADARWFENSSGDGSTWSPMTSIRAASASTLPRSLTWTWTAIWILWPRARSSSTGTRMTAPLTTTRAAASETPGPATSSSPWALSPVSALRSRWPTSTATRIPTSTECPCLRIASSGGRTTARRVTTWAEASETPGPAST